MALGVILSLAVGFGVMALLFYSSRKGYDGPPVLIAPKMTRGIRKRSWGKVVSAKRPRSDLTKRWAFPKQAKIEAPGLRAAANSQRRDHPAVDSGGVTWRKGAVISGASMPIAQKRLRGL
jgi:hypothetical protein